MTERNYVQELAKMVFANAERVERYTNDAVDVGFFGIKLTEGSDLTALRLKNAIVRAEKGINSSMTLADFGEGDVSYTTVGVWLGDQGLALALMGLGKALGLWDIILPMDVGTPDSPLAQQMMGMGFVMLRVGPDSILRA
jgi:hypothetical protein